MQRRVLPVNSMTSTSGTDLAALNSEIIQRILFIALTVHVYNIPPLTTTKGYHAASWTADSNKRLIFTARLRIVETAVPYADGSGESLSTDILLEDPTSGQLFAAAPYTDVGAVEAAIDSSRFFAVRVVGDGGRKAVLGIGFEDRSEAMDFRIALQEVRKVQRIDGGAAKGTSMKEEAKKDAVSQKKDFSLKEGEMIHVDIGRTARKKAVDAGDKHTLFSIAPPPSVQRAGPRDTIPFLPPPPSAQDVKAERRRSQHKFTPDAGSAGGSGFDDGEFGEFQ